MSSLSSNGHLVCPGEFVHDAGCSSRLAEHLNIRAASSPKVSAEHQHVPVALCQAPLECHPVLSHCGSPPPRLCSPSFLVELTFLERTPCSPWVLAFMSGPCRSPRHKSVPITPALGSCAPEPRAACPLCAVNTAKCCRSGQRSLLHSREKEAWH